MAPAGIFVNLTLMLFLPIDTWLRLVIWLAIGLVIYFPYSRRHSLLTRHLLHEVQMPLSDEGEARCETDAGIAEMRAKKFPTDRRPPPARAGR